MIPRYSPPDMMELWSSDTRFQVWLEVELAACEAMEHEKLVPEGTAASIRKAPLQLDSARIDEIEQTVKHDVIAFLTHVEEQVGAPARWLHRGMTSSDVLDTSLAVLLVRTCDALIVRQKEFIKTLISKAQTYAQTPMMGRSHGIHAEPITFGMALAGHLAEANRGLLRLRLARKEVAFGKIAGAVGTYAHLSPSVEQRALSSLGLQPETVSTQVVPRDRHAYFFSTLALVAAGIERLAINVRHWQRTEVSEAEEAFTSGQKGSSAMPHKKNPILSENLCGLARLVRGYASPALEDVALWHERDISHSSVERMIAPDASATMAFMLDRATKLVAGLVVNETNLHNNLNLTGGLFFSEAVLLRLIEKGLARQEAYVFVQRNAMKARSGKQSFPSCLCEDAEVAKYLTDFEIQEAFNLHHHLRHAKTIVDRACQEAEQSLQEE
jgi:adenylosuccinate lyase